MDLEAYKKQLNEFNEKLKIIIYWSTETKDWEYCKNLYHEGRFDIDLQLKTPMELMDEILLEKNSTLNITATLYENPNLTGMRDYLIYFNFF